MATLHNLPPELLILTLSFASSPRDLHNLICASAPCFRAFSSSQVQILSSVLENAIQPGALRHALAISEIPCPLPTGTSAVLLFLARYFSPEEFSFPTNAAQLVSICTLYNQVSRLIDDFFTHSTRLLGGHDSLSRADLLQPKGSESYKFTPLSALERSRLQRAFFRYEIYCRVFPPEAEDWPFSRFSESLFSGEQQFRFFLSRLEPWEVEEMSCIHTYFASLVAHYINDLEDRIIQAVLTSLGARQPAQNSSPSPIYGENYVYFDGLDRRGLDLFEETTRQRIPGFLSNMASLGLGFMIQLIDGDDERRKDMIQARAPFSRDFLPEALQYSPSTHPDVDSAPPTTGTISSPNLGYTAFRLSSWALYLQICDPSGRPSHEPLREMGYVFWDAQRIEIQSVKRQLEVARDASETWHSCRWIKQTSVEERLRGVQLLGSEMDRIAREFSYPDEEDEECEENDE